MAFDSKKTILLEKTYLYVRASLGFQLEGTSTEKIPTNNGFYRFFVDNLQKAIGNSYVNILYDSQDLTLQCFCSDLYMDELMSSDSSAIEDVVEELKKSNSTVLEFENGVSSALSAIHQDNVALHSKLTEFEFGVSSALASNHEDNVALNTVVSSFSSNNHSDIKSFHELFYNFLFTQIWSNSVFSDSILCKRNRGNYYLPLTFSFHDFVSSYMCQFDGGKDLVYILNKNINLAEIDYANFSFSLDVPPYFDSILDVFTSFNFILDAVFYSNVYEVKYPTNVFNNAGSHFESFGKFFNYYRMSSSVSGNGSARLCLCCEISSNLFKFLCLCSREVENLIFISDLDSYSSSVMLARSGTNPCCSLIQSLSIKKSFDSVHDYTLKISFDFPFDVNVFNKFHFYFFVNNSYVEVVPSNVSKSNDNFIVCDFVFSGSSSYNILSMSVFPSV